MRCSEAAVQAGGGGWCYLNWGKRISWAGPGTRTTSRFFSDAVVKKYGRKFYDAFYFDGKRVALHDCVGVALSEDDHTAR